MLSTSATALACYLSVVEGRARLHRCRGLVAPARAIGRGEKSPPLRRHLVAARREGLLLQARSGLADGHAGHRAVHSIAGVPSRSRHPAGERQSCLRIRGLPGDLRAGRGVSRGVLPARRRVRLRDHGARRAARAHGLRGAARGGRGRKDPVEEDRRSRRRGRRSRRSRERSLPALAPRSAAQRRGAHAAGEARCRARDRGDRRGRAGASGLHAGQRCALRRGARRRRGPHSPRSLRQGSRRVHRAAHPGRSADAGGRSGGGRRPLRAHRLDGLSRVPVASREDDGEAPGRHRQRKARAPAGRLRGGPRDRIEPSRAQAEAEAERADKYAFLLDQLDETKRVAPSR